MKKGILLALVAFMLTGVPLYAGNGDLYVNGNLGVGTTTPQQPLHILGTNRKVARFDTGGGMNQTFIEFINNTKTWQVGNHDGFGNYIDWGIRNATDGLNLLNITAAGNIGIGIPTPQQPLHVLGGNRHVARFDTGGGYNQTFVEFINNTQTWQVGNHDGFGNATDWGVRNSTNGINALNITAAGNVGIGTAIPTHALDVNGQVYANNVLLTSDARYKKNINPVHNGLATLLQLDGVSFEWKKPEDYLNQAQISFANGQQATIDLATSTDNQEVFSVRNSIPEIKNFPVGRQYGVIAQAVEKVLPEVVMTDSNGDKAVNYSGIIPILIEAVKAQQTMITNQQTIIAQQQTVLNQQQAQLAVIQQKLQISSQTSQTSTTAQ